MERHPDVIFHVEKETFRVHKIILSMWSKVFERMFESGMKESISSEVTLVGESAAEFGLVLKKLYPPCTFPITSENVEIFLRYSDKYQIDELRDQCEKFLLTINPKIESAALADLYNLPALQERCLPWLTENLTDVINTKEFQLLKKATLQRLIEAVEHQRTTSTKSDHAARISIAASLDRLSDAMYTAIPTCDKRCDLVAKNKMLEFVKPIKLELMNHRGLLS